MRRSGRRPQPPVRSHIQWQRREQLCRFAWILLSTLRLASATMYFQMKTQRYYLFFVNSRAYGVFRNFRIAVSVSMTCSQLHLGRRMHTLWNRFRLVSLSISLFSSSNEAQQKNIHMQKSCFYFNFILFKTSSLAPSRPLMLRLRQPLAPLSLLARKMSRRWRYLPREAVRFHLGLLPLWPRLLFC
jgi:hypothetical protein